MQRLVISGYVCRVTNSSASLFARRQGAGRIGKLPNPFKSLMDFRESKDQFVRNVRTCDIFRCVASTTQLLHRLSSRNTQSALPYPHTTSLFQTAKRYPAALHETVEVRIVDFSWLMPPNTCGWVAPTITSACRGPQPRELSHSADAIPLPATI